MGPYKATQALMRTYGLQVHPGLIELDPEDAVVVVNYEVRMITPWEHLCTTRYHSQH